MGTKRTPLKRRRRQVSRQQEIAAWQITFECGADHFGELERVLGIKCTGSFRVDGEARDLARDTWHRLGADFMTNWQPQTNVITPWALTEFGEPNGGTQCRPTERA